MTTNGWPGDVLLAGIVLLGSSVQWLTGMGFALVAVPALVLLLGPVDGVVLANCAAGAISIVGLAGGWRRVRPGAMVPLCVAAACTVPAGAWMTRQLPEPVLLLVMGGLVTAAVLLVMRGARVPALRGTKGAVAAGAVGGFMNSAAGVGGPPVSLYALNAGWTVREFVPNAQFYGVVVNAFSVAANGVPQLSGTRWTSAVTAMLVGGLIGRGLASHIPEQRARLLVLVLALAGGVTALGKGLWGL
ncbi:MULTISPECIES: sulfite exporter TauE/SafE family protein [unclassified Streptomyces]|uniref:sulfite exporter TauE/SafE family protein n=1 Tax=unclassified Streptomyces TaxID=2593676 RepID=UPI002259F2B2|nr:MULTISPECIES: sulfite exporter TauE/SafE family protein [unclassified Streptomyces]MCX5049894.1 sulfite exporter TauE/SafE family protein [Streptomyces sp. NBC_00474]MCX5286388.1 sulfite exporter TauE/SafE family protein [Streptomyces sp. NBC_00183]